MVSYDKLGFTWLATRTPYIDPNDTKHIPKGEEGHEAPRTPLKMLRLKIGEARADVKHDEDAVDTNDDDDDIVNDDEDKKVTIDSKDKATTNPITTNGTHLLTPPLMTR